MSHSDKKRPKNISNHHLLQKDLFINNFHELDKALNSANNLKSNLKLYIPNIFLKKFSLSMQQSNKRIKSSQIKGIENSKLHLLNESILRIFDKMDNSLDNSIQIYKNTKKENNLFLKKFKNVKILREKMARKKSNSAIIGPTNFSIFDNLVKEYKKNDILIKSVMFKNKDLYRASPIILKNRKELDFFYLFNHEKYYKKTNKNNINIDLNDIKNKNYIKFEKLKEAKYFNKLILSLKKRIKELNRENEEKEEKNKSNNNFNLNLNNVESIIKENNINYSSFIQKEKDDINKIIENINLLKKECGYRVVEKNKSSKIYNNIFSLSFDSLSNIPSTEKTDIPKKNSFSLNNKIFSKKLLYIKSLNKKDNINNTNSLQNSLSFYSKKKTIKINNIKNYKINKILPKRNKSSNIKIKFNITNTKTKKPKNFNNYIYSLKQKNLIVKHSNKFDKLIENLKNTENAYEAIKKMTFTNKEKALKKIYEYFNSKNYNMNRIKNNIKKRDIYNFLDNIKEIINQLNCKQEQESLHNSIHKVIPEKIKFNLKKISNFDKIINGFENKYYLCLLKGQS